MRRPLLVIALACAGALAFASPCAAYKPPETNPRIVVSTPQGDVLIALAPENAPQHVEQFLAAIAAGDFEASSVSRVAPKFYVQITGQPGIAQLAGLPVERDKVGNLRGALSVYDSGRPGEVPTLMFVLVGSPQLDADYTSIGFVEAGMEMLEAIAGSATIGDHQPVEAIAFSAMHVATPLERTLLRQMEETIPAEDDGTSMLAAIFILACAAFLAAMISSFHDRLSRQRTTSLALVVVLLLFFAVWVAFAGTQHSSDLISVALFGGAITIFWLMGRFERPARRGELGGITKPRQLADRELHRERWIDQPQGDREVVVGERDAAAGRVGSAVR